MSAGMPYSSSKASRHESAPAPPVMINVPSMSNRIAMRSGAMSASKPSDGSGLVDLASVVGDQRGHVRPEKGGAIGRAASIEVQLDLVVVPFVVARKDRHRSAGMCRARRIVAGRHADTQAEFHARVTQAGDERRHARGSRDGQHDRVRGTGRETVFLADRAAAMAAAPTTAPMCIE